MSKKNKERRAYLKGKGFTQGYINVTNPPRKLLVDHFATEQERDEAIKKYQEDLRRRGRTEDQIIKLTWERFYQDVWLDYRSRAKSLSKLETRFVGTTEAEFERTGLNVKPVRVQRAVPKTRTHGVIEDPQETNLFRLISGKGNLTDPNPRSEVIARLRDKGIVTLKRIWASQNGRCHGVDIWHYKLITDMPDHRMKLFFCGNQYVWVEEILHKNIARRSMVYERLSDAMNARRFRVIGWVEELPLPK